MPKPSTPDSTPDQTLDKPVELVEGTVTRGYGGLFEVDVPKTGVKKKKGAQKNVGHETLICSLGGRLKKGKRVYSQPIAVGDRVKVRRLETSGANRDGAELPEGFIEELLPRTSQLGRARRNKTAQITLANLDQVVVVMAAREPDFNPHRLDRFLTLAEANDLRAVICLNKIDLVEPQKFKNEIEPLAKMYANLGYPTILTSADVEKEQGIKRLRRELEGHISAFVGSSGVGKSSLVMAVEPNLELWVGDVMEIGKGRHTTTDVSLHPLESTGDRMGYIADTPGIKTVSLLEENQAPLDECFPEMIERKSACRFNDCTHRTEPGCAVLEALEKGEIAASRYESYVRLLEEREAMPTRYPKKDEK